MFPAFFYIFPAFFTFFLVPGTPKKILGNLLQGAEQGAWGRKWRSKIRYWGRTGACSRHKGPNNADGIEAQELVCRCGRSVPSF